MNALKLNILVFLTIFLFVAKPFVRIGVLHLINNDLEYYLLLKPVTKRKQERPLIGDFDISVDQRKQEDVFVLSTLIFSFFISRFFRIVSAADKLVTGAALANLRYRLIPPNHLYLFTGKLVI